MTSRDQNTVMNATLKDLETQALQLSPTERGELIHRLIVSLDSRGGDTPEAIARAWDDEIAQRVADMEAGRTRWVDADEAMARIRARVAAVRSTRAG